MYRNTQVSSKTSKERKSEDQLTQVFKSRRFFAGMISLFIYVAAVALIMSVVIANPELNSESLQAENSLIKETSAMQPSGFEFGVSANKKSAPSDYSDSPFQFMDLEGYYFPTQFYVQEIQATAEALPSQF